ncbi:MAG: MYG1 family protein [Clostridia bacterium]|nr:MYG1 family protein [Clostridia bacterium]
MERLEDANIVTHGGKSFHGDDVFGIVFLELLLGSVNCFRIPYNEYSPALKSENLIVFDTGGGRFDHHQKGGNGYHSLINKEKEAIPFASFGLLWEEYGRKFLKEYFESDNEKFINFTFNYIDYHLVRAIDASDNGIFPSMVEGFENAYRVMTLSCIISFLNPEEIVKDCDNTGLEMAIKLARKAFLITLKRSEGAYNYNQIHEKMDFGAFSNKYDNTITKCLLDEMKNSIPDEINDVDFSEYNDEKSKINFVWDKYADLYCSKEFDNSAEYAKQHFSTIIYGFAADSMGIGMSFNDRVDDMDCPTLKTIFYSPEEYGDDFEEDLSKLFHEVFANTHKAALFKIESKEYVEEAIRTTNGHVLVLHKKAYWQDFVANMPEAKKIWFVISPTDNYTWKIRPIPCKYNENGYKKGFPSKWYGYSKEMDQKSSRFDKDVIFIHPSGFIAICKTLDSALKLTNLALGNQENRPIEPIK